MGKNEEWDSDSDSREGEKSSGSGEEEEEEEEEEEKEIGSKSSDGISEYEKQRLSRIAQNNAKMEALGLPRMASSLMGSPQKSGQQRKGKRKNTVDGGGDGDDEDYRPTDDANADEEEEEEEEEDEDEDYLVDRSSSKSRKHKARNKGSRARKVSVGKKLSSADYVEEDDDLMQAIALSLQDSEKSERPVQRSGNAQTREDAGRKKGKKSEFTSRVQMTEDELILHFFQFDEAGKGAITVRDLERVAIAHDFTWTDKELADMISCFDSNGDGKLNLEDFHNIVGRCKMLQGSGNQ
ncbi:hypothetical protein Tsubulata_010058 [Turnera subulata]|uniref:EF-hand domain-containing protein n=1 Tax=Turnera subulata TaxID=218843 RepID=A0A9Q0JFJ6_9ROSI|nr:hypothetical protein Tsubulata_010058 [Turnera subulata]